MPYREVIERVEANMVCMTFRKGTVFSVGVENESKTEWLPRCHSVKDYS